MSQTRYHWIKLMPNQVNVTFIMSYWVASQPSRFALRVLSISNILSYLISFDALLKSDFFMPKLGTHEVSDACLIIFLRFDADVTSSGKGWSNKVSWALRPTRHSTGPTRYAQTSRSASLGDITFITPFSPGSVLNEITMRTRADDNVFALATKLTSF